MPQTYSDGKKIYSVDMMFAYLNLFKHLAKDKVREAKAKEVEVKKLLHTLEYPGWGNPVKKIMYSPKDVLESPKKKEYQNEIRRIKEADLSYPIILDGNIVVDGVHRLTKAHLEKRKKIKAYVFSKELMKKFLINNSGNWNEVDNMRANEIIELFYKGFCEEKWIGKNKNK